MRDTSPVQQQPRRLMAIHAHPDDESSKGAGTTAKYASEGVEVMVVTCTGGELGDVLNPAAQAEVDERGLAAVRRDEMARAAAVLGVRHAWLGFPDSGYPDGDPKPPVPAGCFADLPLTVTAPPLAQLIREFRPQVVTTYDENGGYPHPDHIRTHEVTVAALELAADPKADIRGEPWQVLKLYYNLQFTKGRVFALHDAMLQAELDSPYHDWIKGWDDREDAFAITSRVHCAPWFEVRDAALMEHRTQVDPDGLWFKVPMSIHHEVWPTEDFHLAWSRVSTALPEDDLFVGVNAGVEESHA